MSKDFYDVLISDPIKYGHLVDDSGSFLYREPIIPNEDSNKNFSLCVDLPTAAEARQMVYNIKEGKYKEELDKIKASIEKAINEGHDCYYYKPLSKCVENILKQYGYDIKKYVSSYNETTITISWGISWYDDSVKRGDINEKEVKK